MDTAESKRSKFARIFPARVQKIRDQLRILGNCSSKSNYDWDQSKVEIFFALILKEIVTLASGFGVPVTAQVGDKDVELF
ncbi:hypothetical protein Syn8016DRAFT_0820 [Synechococcus sp. WH 8016]|nr:hypothetical protein Syn8016DRAFT_0820 [Synechococcus sp. WH 8016]